MLLYDVLPLLRKSGRGKGRRSKFPEANGYDTLAWLDGWNTQIFLHKNTRKFSHLKVKLRVSNRTFLFSSFVHGTLTVYWKIFTHSQTYCNCRRILLLNYTRIEFELCSPKNITEKHLISDFCSLHFRRHSIHAVSLRTQTSKVIIIEACRDN